MRLSLFGVPFSPLSAGSGHCGRTPKLHGATGSSEPHFLGKVRIGGQKSTDFQAELQEKHPRGWRGRFSAGCSDSTKLLPSVLGDAPGDKKGCWKIGKSEKKGPEMTQGPGKMLYSGWLKELCLFILSTRKMKVTWLQHTGTFSGRKRWAWQKLLNPSGKGRMRSKSWKQKPDQLKSESGHNFSLFWSHAWSIHHYNKPQHKGADPGSVGPAKMGHCRLLLQVWGCLVPLPGPCVDLQSCRCSQLLPHSTTLGALCLMVKFATSQPLTHITAGRCIWSTLGIMIENYSVIG